MGKASCVCCGSTDTVDLIAIDRIPVLCNELHDDAEKAIHAPVGEMNLCFCQHCGHYFNRSYDAEKLYYSPNYETSLYSSAVFREYAESLVNRLVEQYRLHHKQILEIGCGRGEFLRHLCAKGNNKGLGFDTSAPFAGVDPSAENVTFVQDYFSRQYDEVRADLVICQQVLEHVENPQQFLAELAATETFRDGSPIFYCEVPNGLYTVEQLGIWDLIYEHVSYFTDRSLAQVFQAAGFEILNLGTAFGGQYLYVEATLATSALAPARPPLTANEQALARDFADQFETKVAEYRQLLKEVDAEKMFIWGAGSKGITFANLIDPGGELAGLVDRNPVKRGKYIGGTGARIVGPDALNADNTAGAFVMNPQYLDEIKDDLSALGVDAKLHGA